MASIYKKIKGRNYDKSLLDIADKSVSGKGDGRISTDDAKKLLKAVKDSNIYSDVEKKTMEYIRDKYQFTDAADSFFRSEIRKWAASKTSSVKITKPASKKKSATKSIIKTSQKIVDSTLPLINNEVSISNPVTSPKLKKVDDIKIENIKPFPWWIILLLALLFILLLMFRFGCITNKNPILKTSEKNPNPLSTPILKTPELISQTQNLLPDFKKEDISKLTYSFKKKSFNLNDETKNSLTKLAEFLNKNPNSKLQIIGHSCDLGTDSLNQKFSDLRSNKVKLYLISKGIKSNRLIALGKGESEPIAPNDIEENRQKNRRVQFILE